MALSIGRVTAGDTALAADLNQLIDLLEGGASETLAFHLKSETGEDFIVQLSDAAGVREFQIKDSAGTTIFTVDSDGNLTHSGSYSPGTMVVPSSAAPAPTVEGEIHWDSDDHRLVVGDGATSQTFYPGTEAAAWETLDTQVLGSAAASISFTGLDTSYKAFRITAFLIKDGTGADVNLRFNNDSGANYNWANSSTSGAGVTGIEFSPATAFAANTSGIYTVVIGKQASDEPANVTIVGARATTGDTVYGEWTNVADLISRIDIVAAVGNLDTDTRVTLEGLRAP